MTFSLVALARALDGDVSGHQVSAPGPGHSAKDRSMWVRPWPDAPDGILCGSFADDSWRRCKDHVRAKLGLGRFEASRPRMAVPAATHDDREGRRINAARIIFAETSPMSGTLAEKYLRDVRGLSLDEDLSHAVRFHSRCPWGDGDTTLYVPAMIVAMRQIDGDALMAVQRTRLGPDGAKIERRMLGKASGAAIKIDPDEDVTYGLAIGERLETCLAARQLGFRACWALGAAGAIRTFPVLAGVDCLTLLAETDDSGANARAITTCGDRWLAAGREVIYATPGFKGDMNDVAIRSARR